MSLDTLRDGSRPGSQRGWRHAPALRGGSAGNSRRLPRSPGRSHPGPGASRRAREGDRRSDGTRRAPGAQRPGAGEPGPENRCSAARRTAAPAPGARACRRPEHSRPKPAAKTPGGTSVPRRGSGAGQGSGTGRARPGAGRGSGSQVAAGGRPPGPLSPLPARTAPGQSGPAAECHADLHRLRPVAVRRPARPAPGPGLVHLPAAGAEAAAHQDPDPGGARSHHHQRRQGAGHDRADRRDLRRPGADCPRRSGPQSPPRWLKPARDAAMPGSWR